MLAGELFSLLREVMAGRDRLEGALRDAQRALVLARAFQGDAALESLGDAGAREVPVQIDDRRVWGVPVHRISAPRLARAAEGRGASPLSWGLAAADAALRHEEALELLLTIASRELHLARLGDEIRDTSRRINALEQIVVPRLGAEARRIALALEERAREEAVRLKAFKRRG